MYNIQGFCKVSVDFIWYIIELISVNLVYFVDTRLNQINNIRTHKILWQCARRDNETVSTVIYISNIINI